MSLFFVFSFFGGGAFFFNPLLDRTACTERQQSGEREKERRVVKGPRLELNLGCC